MSQSFPEVDGNAAQIELSIELHPSQVHQFVDRGVHARRRALNAGRD